jgi:predicted nuclease of predicted toxin-antitoxin system
MKIKLDENLPYRLAEVLQRFGHDVHTTYGEGLIGSSDPEIWRAAQSERRFLVTQDLDFSDPRQFVPGTHFGVLLVRLNSPNRENLIERIGEIFRTENVQGWGGCFVVVTERKVRVLKPPKEENPKTPA